MAIKTDSPQIVLLRQIVEKRFGHPVSGRSDFSLLVSAIENVTNEHVAENTLRRLWGKMSGYTTVFTRTLDVLCHYVGYEHWNSFCISLQKSSDFESKVISDGTSIKVEDLVPGDRIRIGWCPDRECVVEYMGGRIFRAIDIRNSTIQVGDTFECSIMLKNFPLFVDNFVHGDDVHQRYSMGHKNGLTILEKL